MRELLDRHEEQRWGILHTLVGVLHGRRLPADLDLIDTANRLYALLSREVYWLLVHRRDAA